MVARAAGCVLLLGLTACSTHQHTAPPPDPEPVIDARQQELEKKFRETLTNAVFDGHWYEIKDGKIGEARTEKYTISRATKVSDKNHWLILARVQYGTKDVTLPVPVVIEWADDTPVISITNAGLPGLGTYSARVLVYDGLYAGTWSGSGHGGVLSGQIVPHADNTTEKSGGSSTNSD